MVHGAKNLAPLHHSSNKTPYRPPQGNLAARPPVHGPGSCSQLVLLSRGKAFLVLLCITGASSFLTPVDEFLSTLCTMSSTSSLTALSLTIYGCTARSRSHLVSLLWFQHRTKCPWIAAASAVMLFPGARASCKMADPSPGSLGSSQCRLFKNRQILGRGKFHPEISQCLAGF